MNTVYCKPKMSMLSILAICYLLLWATSPPMASASIYRIVGLLCVGFLFLKIAARYRGNGLWKTILLILCILFATFLTGDSINYRINTLIFLCLLLCGLVFDTCTISPKKANRLVMLLFLNCIVWEFFTLTALFVRPNIMRLAVRASFVAPFGVGGYGFLYTVVLFVPLSLDYTLNRSRPMIYRGIAAVFTAATVLLAYKSQYFMALLIVLLEIALYFVLGIKSRNLRLLTTSCVMIVAVVLYVNAENIIYFFLNNLQPGALYRKLLDILDMLQGEATVEDGEFATRYERYTRDLGLMLRSPIWGSLSYIAVGKHSNILDIFAQYGLPVGFLYTTTLCRRVTYCKIPVTKVVLVAVVLLFLLNSQTYQMGAIYLLIPLYAAIYNGKKGADGAGE